MGSRILLSSDSEDDIMPTKISFNDVKDALKHYSGGSLDETNKWIADFDKIATTCGWNDVQKYIFALKLLDGEAAACVEAHPTVTTYEELTTLLLAKYKLKAKQVNIHKVLSQRKKLPTETPIEYMYKMKTLGKDAMDDRSMIEYIVDGFPGNDKATLYQATTYDELIDKLNSFKFESTEKPSFDKNKKRNVQNDANNKPQGRYMRILTQWFLYIHVPIDFTVLV